ncbi:alpha/beta hydrolase [Corynebacterium striatum]|uniref:alpha/beta hydrolase n=1 Tax=Corynebacterium striatum TaxID=43770 RepID=UPI00242E74DD|nr:alpha/beta hydrolase [Corynebacterium striatum]MDK8811487.1 alpha/beta hydrolase [Corynebacterium striatum]
MNRAASLTLSARHLHNSGAELDLFIKGSLDNWVRLPIFGDFAEAARSQLSATTGQLMIPAEAMRAAALVLESYQPLLTRVEELRAQAIGMLTRMDEVQPWSNQLGTMLNALDALADALDWACAAQIDALCTPELAPGGNYFEDFSEMPLDSLHQMQLSTAPPEAAALAANNPDVKILEAGPGRVAVLVDPTKVGTAAASVTTFIGGVGSSDPGGWQRGIERARVIAHATGGPAVAWMGYSAPRNLSGALHEAPATRGAQDLQRFQRAVGHRFPSAQRIVVGYSYGSVVAGKAVRADNVADDVVFVGSPGTDAATASELRARTWASTNAHDPIGTTTGPGGGIHGPDPSSAAFAATPLPGANRLPGDHSSYFEDPAFLRGLGRIARR